jgi:serine/threonine protein phosphatase PrpC
MGNSIITKRDLHPTYDTIKVDNKNAVSVGIKGARPTMEDESIMCELDLPGYYLFAVFDGHGGSLTSNYLKNNFQIFFQKHRLWKNYVMKETSSDLKNSCLSSYNSIETGIDEWTTLFTKIFIEFDEKLFNEHFNDGSTAVVVLLTPKNYICASVGDSEASIIDKSSSYKLSTNHKPLMEEEKKRIIASNNFVMRGRINGDINLSRAFGDFKFKAMTNLNIYPSDYGIIVIPTVKMFPRNIKDQYLVLACDGLWDIVVDLISIEDLLITDENLIDQERYKVI